MHCAWEYVYDTGYATGRDGQWRLVFFVIVSHVHIVPILYYLYLYIYIYTSIHIHKYTWSHTNLHTQIHVYIYMYLTIYLHTYTHIGIDIDIDNAHTCIWICVRCLCAWFACKRLDSRYRYKEEFASFMGEMVVKSETTLRTLASDIWIKLFLPIYKFLM